MRAVVRNVLVATLAQTVAANAIAATPIQNLVFIQFPPLFCMSPILRRTFDSVNTSTGRRFRRKDYTNLSHLPRLFFANCPFPPEQRLTDAEHKVRRENLAAVVELT